MKEQGQIYNSELIQKFKTRPHAEERLQNCVRARANQLKIAVIPRVAFGTLVFLAHTFVPAQPIRQPVGKTNNTHKMQQMDAQKGRVLRRKRK